MSEPNYGAYELYQRMMASPAVANAPVIVIDGGQPGLKDDYVQVEFDNFRGLGQAETQAAIAKFQAVTEGRRGGPAGAVYEFTNFAASVAEAQSGGLMMQDHGGGVAYTDRGMVMTDRRTSSLNELYDDVLSIKSGAQPAGHEALYDRFAREHETAHQLLGLDEPGSDYAAAVRLLKENPGAETRQFLQNQADMRAIAPFAVDANRAGPISLSYGYGNARAIQAAMAMPQDELQAMTAEQIYENGKSYDAMNAISSGRVGAIRPEMRVRQAMLSVDPSLSDGVFQSGRITKAAESLVAADAFENGTAERAVVDDLVAASRRTDRLPLETQRPSAPTPSSPAPQI